MNSAVCFNDQDDVRRQVGKEVCVTDWVTVGQERIDRFAQATGDFQWIHVDVERSAESSPYGSTIAHGFLTLSLLGKFYEDYLSCALPFCDIGVNYGLNKVRFTNPVRVDSEVRGRFVLAKVEDVDGGMQMTFYVTIEIDGQEKPACIAESVVRRYFKTQPEEAFR